MKQIYLDYAAATPLAPEAFEAMQPYLTTNFYNPSATYLAGQSVHHAVDQARAGIAGWLGVRSSEIIFTAGGTEANNLAIHGVMRKFPGSNVVVSAIEHEALLAPAHQYDCREVAVKSNGILNFEAFAAAIDDNTVLVSVMYANNEIGTIQPLRKIKNILDEIRSKRIAAGNDLPLYFHTDACQAGNYLDLHVSGLGVDMLTLNAGKIYGPKQTGLLYVRGGIVLDPLIAGGGQENGMRSGTENPSNIVGFAAALNLVQKDRQTEVKRLQDVQNKIYELLREHLPQAVINGSTKLRLPNNVHITIPGSDNERLMMALDERGIQCAVGSACSASSDEPSHVLKAIGLSDAEAQSSLRFTMGRQTTQTEIKHAIIRLTELASANR